jgi:hypothetical protein
MHVGIDQARNGRTPVGIDYDIASAESRIVGGADMSDPALIADDGVARGKWLAPITADDTADVDDGGTHDD